MLQNYMPNDKVKSCKYIENGIAFQPEGIFWCCNSTIISPRIFSDREISSGIVSQEKIIQKRKEFFHYLNTNDPRAGICLKCGAVYETEFKNIQFDRIEGIVNIQPFSLCNLRCKYCLFTQRNTFYKPSYKVSAIYDLLSAYSKEGKVRGTWLTVNGGEPAILKDYGTFCEKLVQLGIGSVCIFSNCVKYEQKFADLLHNNEAFLVVSLDSGVPTTFAEVRGVPAMWKVVDTLVRYRKTGTNRLWLKYIITKDNCNEDDLFSFVFLMTALRPDKIYICPEFPYGERETPYEFVTFGAKMWYFLKKYGALNIHIQTDDNIADPKFKKYSEGIREEFAKLVAEAPLDDTFVLPAPEQVIQASVESARSEVQERANMRFKSYINKRIVAYKDYMQNNNWQKTVDKLYSLLFKKSFEYYFIKKSQLFDEEFYLQQLSPADRMSFSDGIAHYCSVGWKEGKNPNVWFDSQKYLCANSDVHINPFFHYLRNGIFEGRTF